MGGGKGRGVLGKPEQAGHWRHFILFVMDQSSMYED